MDISIMVTEEENTQHKLRGASSEHSPSFQGSHPLCGTFTFIRHGRGPWKLNTKIIKSNLFILWMRKLKSRTMNSLYKHIASKYSFPSHSPNKHKRNRFYNIENSFICAFFEAQAHLYAKASVPMWLPCWNSLLILHFQLDPRWNVSLWKSWLTFTCRCGCIKVYEVIKRYEIWI